MGKLVMRGVQFNKVYKLYCIDLIYFTYVTISSRGGMKVLWVHSAHARNNKTAVLVRFIVSDIDRIIYIHNVLEIPCSEHMKYNH